MADRQTACVLKPEATVRSPRMALGFSSDEHHNK